MQVITDYTDVSRVTYDPPPPPTTRHSDCLYGDNNQHTSMVRVERDYLEDTDSRDDGYILGLFERPAVATETTLDKL